MLEYLAPNFLYSLAKDAWAAFCSRKRRLSPSDIVKQREHWKSTIEEKIWERRQKKLGMDVIVRDVKRIDDYPDVKLKRKGISAWYKCGLMSTYHRGIMLGLRWESLKLDNSKKWRYANRKIGENGDIIAVLIGYVPYENIESIDWNGDEYYNKPHIYCHFDQNVKTPYEKLAFCEENELNNIPYYTEICLYKPVYRRSRRMGIC